ncbi:copper chaperone PCu(A)C [Streptosporangium sandarakinum]|uniref:copper chaperone PCu(A)C n=1 Tax=Streptosporangium sandarakinum TaxID=1260955 RepID=UPI00344043E0
MIIRRVVPAGLLAVLTAVAVGACGAQQDAPAPDRAAAPAATPAAAPSGSGTPGASSPLTIIDPWVKTAKKGMTAAFGTLVNHTAADVTVVSASSPLSSMIELHEVADVGGKSVMRPKEGGFTVPANGTHPLQPGGDHIMLMGVTDEVKPGARIPFTLTLKDGGTVEFTAIGKDFAGGNENYDPGADKGHN